MKILVFSNIPAPYFVEYLNELGKYAEVTAIFEKKSFAHRDGSWTKVNVRNFRIVFLKGINIGKTKKYAPEAIRYIRKNRDAIIIIANPLTLVGMMCIDYCLLHKIPFVIQSEGGIPKDGKGLKERIKRHYLHGATLYLSGMKKQRDYFEAYGAPKEKIRHYPFSSLHQADLIQKIPTIREKEEIKRSLGIKENSMILFVGRTIESKGIDTLIKAAQGLPKDAGIYIVGGEESESNRALAASLGVHNLHYYAFMPLERLKQFYLAADIFVLPTRRDTWGLVINEAMSFGLPVITTTSCVAGVELIEDGENGFLVESEDWNFLYNKLAYLLVHPEERESMGKQNISLMKRYTYENMAYEIHEILYTYYHSDKGN